MTSKHIPGRHRKLCLITAFACTAFAPALALAQKPYTIQDHWKIGGEGGWDYLAVDSTLHRLYITHGPRVEVLDLSTGKPVGAITGLKGTHGVAFDLEGKLGYISDGRANAVIVFDRVTFATVASIPAGTNPDGILFEPVTKTVWAFNGSSKDVTVIDAATQKVTATVALPGKPEFPQADGTGNIYDNIEDKNKIVRLDAHSPKITATWPACESPSGMAIDLKGHRLFSVCDGKKMAVVDYHSGKLLATPTIGDGPDAAGFDPSSNLAFASNGDGTLSIIDASSSTYTVKQTLVTEPRARTMALDPATDKVYLVTAKFGPAPAATAANPRPRPSVLPDSFVVLVAGHE
jgi:YVTN family beta-propeller protein